MENEQNESIFDFTLEGTTLNLLGAVGKWARFSAIVVWILIAIVVVLFVFLGVEISSTLGDFLPKEYNAIFSKSSMGGILIAVSMVICIAFALYISILFGFGNNLMKAVRENNQEALEKSFNLFNTYLIITGVFTFLGILTSISNLIF